MIAPAREITRPPFPSPIAVPVRVRAIGHNIERTARPRSHPVCRSVVFGKPCDASEHRLCQRLAPAKPSRSPE